MYDAFISEMEQIPSDEAYLEQNNPSLVAHPLRVLTTGSHGIHTFDPGRSKDAQQQAYQDNVARSQAKWLAVSSNAKQSPLFELVAFFNRLRQAGVEREWGAAFRRTPYDVSTGCLQRSRTSKRYGPEQLDQMVDALICCRCFGSILPRLVAGASVAMVVRSLLLSCWCTLGRAMLRIT